MTKPEREEQNHAQAPEKLERRARKEERAARQASKRAQLEAERARTETERDVIDRFNLLWYERERTTWKRGVSWMGVPMQQCPTDLWVYQELIFRTRPEVVEVGVKRGGLTRYVADLLDLLNPGDPEAAQVVAIDLHVRDAARNAVGPHPRVTLIEGSSTADEVVDQVRARCAVRRALVLLDSDHRAKHVRAELELYAPLVPVDGYLIVNDTNVNGHPVAPAFGPGPYEAVDDFLGSTDAFEVDPDCEKHLLTVCPRGYLRRVKPHPE